MSEERMALIKADLRANEALFYRIDESGEKTNGSETMSGEVEAIYLGVEKNEKYGDKYSIVIDLVDEELDMLNRVIINQSSAASGLVASLVDVDLVGKNLWMALNVSDPVKSKAAGRAIRFVNIYSTIDREKTEWGISIEDMQDLKKNVDFFCDTVESLDGFVDEISIDLPRKQKSNRSSRSSRSERKGRGSSRRSRRGSSRREESENATEKDSPDTKAKPKRSRRKKRDITEDDVPNIDVKGVEVPETPPTPYEDDDLPF